MKFNKKSELQQYFNNILNDNMNEIVKIVSLTDGGSTDLPIRYSIDEPLYIIFKNEKALIISYFNVCEIIVDYRKLTIDEKKDIAQINCNDFFNRVSDVYDYHTLKLSKRITVLLKYDALEKIEVKYFEGNYEIWENNKIITKKGTLENFDEIIFTMKNGKSFYIKPEAAIFAGYLDVWSNDTYENIIKY